MVEVPHTDLCEAISGFKHYHTWLAKHNDIVASAENCLIHCSFLGQYFREAGECVLAERADDFLYLCRRVMMEHTALNGSDDDENSTSDESSDWPSKCLLTTNHRFNSQRDELKEHICEYELYVHKCAGCDDYIRRYLENRKKSRKSTCASVCSHDRTCALVCHASVLTLARSRVRTAVLENSTHVE